MISRVPVICRACARFKPTSGTCTAFPDGIPDAIVVYGRDHRTSVRGDGGIVFKQGDTPEQQEAFQHWKRLNDAR